jgi:hypothetical protein
MSVTIEGSTPTTGTRTDGGERFLGGALLGLAAVLAVYQLVTAPFIPVLTAFTVLYGAVGVGLWRSPRRWLLTLAGLLAVAYVVGGFPVFAEHLAHPESPLGFLTDTALLIGLGVVIVGVVRALRGTDPRVPRPVLVGAAALGGIAVAVAAVAVATTDSAVRQADDVTLTVADWEYPELSVPVTAGALWIDNLDPFHHTLLVEGTDIREVLPASTAVRLPVDLAPGTYRYLCDVPGHEAMSGTLHVR